TLTLNLMIDPGSDVSGITLHFYENSVEGPGEQIGSASAVPSIEVIGDAFGYDLVEATLTLDNPFQFEGNSYDMVYWIGVQIDYDGENSYWEVTTAINTPNEMYELDDGQWVASSTAFDTAYDGGMLVSGDCTSADLPPCERVDAGQIDQSDFGICLNRPVVASVSVVI